MIVKVQQELLTDSPRILIYTRKRRICQILPMPPGMAEYLGDRPKAYFRARWKGTLIEFLGEVTVTDW